MITCGKHAWNSRGPRREVTKWKMHSSHDDAAAAAAKDLCCMFSHVSMLMMGRWWRILLISAARRQHLTKPISFIQWIWFTCEKMQQILESGRCKKKKKSRRSSRFRELWLHGSMMRKASEMDMKIVKNSFMIYCTFSLPLQGQVGVPNLISYLSHIY